MMLLVMTVFASTASAGSFSIIVETTNGADINAITAALGGTLIDSMPGNVYLISVSSMPSTYPAGVKSIEPDGIEVSPGVAGAVFSVHAPSSASWYGNQPAMRRINVGPALSLATGRGVIIADINSLVDYGHPALIGHLTSGSEFLKGNCKSGSGSAGSPDESSAAFLDQASAAFLDESSAAFLDESSAAFLDESSAAFLDANAPAHGHGTMVAGILAAIAPDSMIMPLRAIDDQGCGTTFNISKAIKYAVGHGAQVINISFGVSGQSNTLKNVIGKAIDAGVTVVASAGNGNTGVPQYPAAYDGVLAVAATNIKDVKTTFSNYGSSIFVSAPGLNIVSTYPGGYYAVLSGTSFSAPMVAAEAALLRSLKTSGWKTSIARGVVKIDAVNPSYVGQLGYGRIDLLKALSQ
jgi:hypothetical protein